MYIPSQRGTLSNSPPLSISTFSPYDSENTDMRNASTSGVKIINDVLTTNIHPYTDDQITLDTLSDDISGDVLVWVGHGTYDASLHSILFTGETFDLPSMDAFHFRDSVKQLKFYSKGIVLAGISSEEEHGTERLGITSKWIHNNASLDFNEGLIYLLACRGAQDDVLVNTLINDSGAEVVFASQGTEDVGVGYAERMQDWIFKYMTGKGADLSQTSFESAVNNPDGVFHTASEALTLSNQLLTRYSNELIRNGFQFNGNSFYDSDNDGDLDIQNCHIEIFGNTSTDFQNYTLCGGITFSMDESIKSDQLSMECVDDNDNKYEVEKHGDKYYVNKLGKGTYSLKINSNGKTMKTIEGIRVRDHRYNDLGKISLDLSISSYIGQYKGKTYKIGNTVAELEGLPVKPAKYDYICSFTFYNDKVYYCCKDGGTSDYRMALYEADVDGTNQRELFAPDSTEYNLDLFAVKEGNLYYRVAKWSGSTLNETFYKISLQNGETTLANDISSDVKEGIRPDSTYLTCNGCKFYESKSSNSRFLNDCITMKDGEGTVKRIVQTDGSLSLDGVVADDLSNDLYLYYSTIIDYRDAVLYCMNLSTGETREVDSHMAAGGGYYFNW